MNLNTASIYGFAVSQINTRREEDSILYPFRILPRIVSTKDYAAEGDYVRVFSNSYGVAIQVVTGDKVTFSTTKKMSQVKANEFIKAAYACGARGL